MTTFNKNKIPFLKGNHYRIIAYLLNWIASKNSPISKVIDGDVYYWFSFQKIADDLMLSYTQVKRAMRRLRGCDSSIGYGAEKPFLYGIMVYSKTDNREFFKFDVDQLKKILEDTPFNKRVLSKLGADVAGSTLFDVGGDSVKKGYSAEAEGLVSRFLLVHAGIFGTRIGKTKTFERCCRIVQDIYNGAMLNPRIYSLSAVNRCRQFDVDGWREKLASVKGNWEKVEKLLSQSAENFRKMHEAMYMPTNKSWLPKGFDKWLYDADNFDFPSYFIFSFNAPAIPKEQFRENCADKIFEALPKSVRRLGNQIVGEYDINNNYVFWKNLRDLYGWCDKVCSDDALNHNMTYWVGSPSEIIKEFISYCEENGIDMNESTVCVKTAFERNSPFKWFVKDAVKEHKLDDRILEIA